MKKASRKGNYPQLTIVVKGTAISIVGTLVTSAIAAYLILVGTIPEKGITAAVLSILLLSSFIGTKYTNMKARDRRHTVAFITGVCFVLSLTIVNVILQKASHNDILPKTMSAMLGTALGTVGTKGKRRGGAATKHRRNR